MRAFRALYISTLREFMRDPTALVWIVVSPLIFMLVLGMVYGDEGDITLSIGLVNADGDASAQLVAAFEQIEVFDIKAEDDRDDALDELEDGNRDAVIVIPEGTGAALAAYFAQLAAGEAGVSTPLDVYYDPSDQQTAQIVLSVIDKVIAGMNEGISGTPPALTVVPHSTARDDWRYIDFLMPGILALNLLQLGLYGTADPLVGLREQGVLRRMGATPLTKPMLLLSQIAFRVTVAGVTTLIVILTGVIVFNVHVEYANILSITLVLLLGSALFITMGYWLSGMAKTQNAVQGLVALPYFIMMFLSGLFFPMEMMPEWMRPLIDVLPVTYLGDALRATVLGAGTYYSMTRNVTIMLLWTAVCSALAVRFFKWEPQA